MTLAAVLRELEAAGVELWLDGDRVRWRGDVAPELLALARRHRVAIAEYLARRCEVCALSRTIMVLMDADAAPWWLCSRCYRGDVQRRSQTASGATSEAT